jgi:hypothetical protein
MCALLVLLIRHLAHPFRVAYLTRVAFRFLRSSVCSTTPSEPEGRHSL